MTADRWARLLRALGHRVTIRRDYDGSKTDVLIALHARRSGRSIRRFARVHPDRPLIVALTGTDLYRDIRTSAVAQRSLELATRLVVLQSHGIDELAPVHRAKTRVVLQSAEPTRAATRRRRSRRGRFRVCVLGHLRHEKDPTRTALASRRLPPSSRIVVTHLGAALEAGMRRWAMAETRANPRYRWLGELPRGRARAILAQSDLMVLSSRMEGGANVLSEAIVDRVPILASNISGSRGILGGNYPGLFPVSDTAALARLLYRAETDDRFYRRLARSTARLAPRFTPRAEQRAWQEILDELCAAKASDP